MSYQRIATPRFYTDMINYLLNRGRPNTDFAVFADSTLLNTIGTFTSGSAPELFDMKPLNKCSWDTSSTATLQADHVLVTLNLSSANYAKGYVAILNHNLVSSKGKIRIFAGDNLSDVQTVDAGGIEDSVLDVQWDTFTTTEVVNAESITVAADGKSIVIEPATDGTTIIRFPDQNIARYWGIQFEGAAFGTGAAIDGTWDGRTDLFVGGIMVGEYYDMPHSPDLGVKRTIDYDKNTVQESIGGQRYSNMSSFGGLSNSTSKSPFNLAEQHYDMLGGRITYDMKFSYLNDSDVLPTEDYSFRFGSDSVIGDVWNITHGSHTPFIFSIDKDSEGDGAESEHIFARFAQDKLEMNQVAYNVYDVSLKIEEEF